MIKKLSNKKLAHYMRNNSNVSKHKSRSIRVARTRKNVSRRTRKFLHRGGVETVKVPEVGPVKPPVYENLKPPVYENLKPPVYENLKVPVPVYENVDPVYAIVEPVYENVEHPVGNVKVGPVGPVETVKVPVLPSNYDEIRFLKPLKNYGGKKISSTSTVEGPYYDVMTPTLIPNKIPIAGYTPFSSSTISDVDPLYEVVNNPNYASAHIVVPEPFYEEIDNFFPKRKKQQSAKQEKKILKLTDKIAKYNRKLAKTRNNLEKATYSTIHTGSLPIPMARNPLYVSASAPTTLLSNNPSDGTNESESII